MKVIVKGISFRIILFLETKERCFSALEETVQKYNLISHLIRVAKFIVFFFSKGFNYIFDEGRVCLLISEKKGASLGKETFSFQRLVEPLNHFALLIFVVDQGHLTRFMSQHKFCLCDGQTSCIGPILEAVDVYRCYCFFTEDV